MWEPSAPRGSWRPLSSSYDGLASFETQHCRLGTGTRVQGGSCEHLPGAWTSQLSGQPLHSSCLSRRAQARAAHVLPAMDAIIESMAKLSLEFSDAAMLARTHGQTASPTTMGKEFANVAYRLARQRKQVRT